MNAITFVTLIVIQLLSSTGKFGPTNQVISNRYPTPITPSGYAFSIWGLIWLLQTLFIVVQCLPILSLRDRQEEYLRAISFYYVASLIFEICWTFAFASGIMWLSFILLSSTVIALGIAYSRLKSIRRPTDGCVMYCAYVLPITIHLSWVFCATSVNSLMVADSFDLSYPSSAGCYLLILATLFALYMQRKNLDIVPSLVVIWTLCAIFVGNEYFDVQTTCAVCVGILTGSSIALEYQKQKKILAE